MHQYQAVSMQVIQVVFYCLVLFSLLTFPVRAQVLTDQIEQIRALSTVIEKLQAQVAALRAVNAQGVSTTTPVVIDNMSNQISATVTALSNFKKPIVRGTATGTKQIRLVISNGNHVYESRIITVLNGRWLHKVSKDLKVGEYTTTVFASSTKLAEKKFAVVATQREPRVTLTTPTQNSVFHKDTDDNVLIRWTARNVPKNTNVIVEIKSENSPTIINTQDLSFVRKATNGTSDYRLRLNDEIVKPGKYTIRVLLEACPARDCLIDLSAHGLRDTAAVYAISEPRTITVVTSNKASVNLIPLGRADAEIIGANITDQLDFLYYPSGAISACNIIGTYAEGKTTIKHVWPPVIAEGQYKKVTLPAVSIGSLSVLEEVAVECQNEEGKVIARDAITISVVQGQESNYEILVSGKRFEFGKNLSEFESAARCYKVYDSHRGQRVQCIWNGRQFFDDSLGTLVIPQSLP